MFKWLNKQGVESDAGFIVQRTGRFTCVYQERGRTLELEVESGFMGDTPCINIRRDSFKRWSNGVTIPPDQQEQMLQNFKEAMEFQGLKLLVMN